MILVIIMASPAYKRAKANGRNGLLWSLIATGVFLGAQIIIGLGTVMLLGFGTLAWGWSETIFEDYIVLINVIGIVASFLACWPVLRYIDKPVSEEPFIAAPPPPPPNFATSVSPENRIDLEE